MKNLNESKKAKQTWIGAGVIIAALFGGYKLGIPLEWIKAGIPYIAGIFGASIVAQGGQDVADKMAAKKDEDKALASKASD